MQCNGITRKGLRCSRILPIVDTPDKCLCFQHKKHDDTECPICLESLKGNKKVLTTPCSHKFHTSCMKTWLANNDTCPCCRATLKKEHRQMMVMIIVNESNGMAYDVRSMQQSVLSIIASFISIIWILCQL